MRRSDFPIFDDSELIYLDSGASAQKPRRVIEALDNFYRTSYANVHRGLYTLSEKATSMFEGARTKVARFIGAGCGEEVIFTRGTTEGINLVAHCWGRSFIGSGDEIVSTIIEHHSNFVPWQQLALNVGAKISFVGLTSEGDFDRAEFSRRLNKKTKLVAITALANGLGIKLPIKELIEEAHAVGAIVLVDAAQSVAHEAIDVRALDADFVAFSGHKIYGPTGIGVLYGKRKLLEEMPPFHYGGDMILSVSVEKTTFNTLPHKFEAGTPHIAGVIGLGAALDYVAEIGLEKISAHEAKLVKLLEERLSQIKGVQMLGPRGKHHALVCFIVNDLHPHDLAQFLNEKQIAIRAGHHCAQPLLHHFDIVASSRASLGVYNTEADIDALCRGIEEAKRFFGIC